MEMSPRCFSASTCVLTLFEAGGVWPDELLHAYVAIPKASGGSRPQRPITVLDVAYRIRAKGIVLACAPALQSSYLGDSAMGFRAQSGTFHKAQLLYDTEWSMSNGLAQGCPASPDLLNILFEPFHRWASQGRLCCWCLFGIGQFC